MSTQRIDLPAERGACIVSPPGLGRHVTEWRYKGASSLHLARGFPSPAKETPLLFHEQH